MPELAGSATAQVKRDLVVRPGSTPRASGTRSSVSGSGRCRASAGEVEVLAIGPRRLAECAYGRYPAGAVTSLKSTVAMLSFVTRSAGVPILASVFSAFGRFDGLLKRNSSLQHDLLDCGAKELAGGEHLLRGRTEV